MPLHSSSSVPTYIANRDALLTDYPRALGEICQKNGNHNSSYRLLDLFSRLDFNFVREITLLATEIVKLILDKALFLRYHFI